MRQPSVPGLPQAFGPPRPYQRQCDGPEEARLSGAVVAEDHMPARALRSRERPPMRTQRSDIPDLDVADVHGGKGTNSVGDYRSLRPEDAFALVAGWILSNSKGAYGGVQAPRSGGGTCFPEFESRFGDDLSGWSRTGAGSGGAGFRPRGIPNGWRSAVTQARTNVSMRVDRTGMPTSAVICGEVPPVARILGSSTGSIMKSRLPLRARDRRG